MSTLHRGRHRIVMPQISQTIKYANSVLDLIVVSGRVILIVLVGVFIPLKTHIVTSQRLAPVPSMLVLDDSLIQGRYLCSDSSTTYGNINKRIRNKC